MKEGIEMKEGADMTAGRGTRDGVVRAVREQKAIAIIRGQGSEVCLRLAEAYAQGGLGLVEVTFNQKAPETWKETAAAITAIRERFAGVLRVGAGTVLTAEQLTLCEQAGGAYMITPNVDAALIRDCVRRGLVAMPGAFTPSEAVAAHAAGADFVKLFPASSLGPAYVKALAAPLAHIPFLAVGGISAANAPAFLEAGCVGVGVGGNLTNREWIAAGAWGRIREAARALAACVRALPCACLAACALALGAPAAEAAPRRPVLIVNEDNDHYFKLDRSLMTVEALERYIDGYAQGHVTHFFMCPSGQRPSYGSRVWEPIWAGCAPEYYRNAEGTNWTENAKLLHDRGIDPYAVWIRRCREKGISPWISPRMNDTHFAHITNYFRNTTFWRTRRDLWRKPDWKPGEHGNLPAFDFSKPEARTWILSLVKEQIDRWDVDGVELDWMRMWEHLTPGKERAQAHHLTEMVRTVRGWTDEAARRRGHPVRLGVRVPSDPESARAFGMDAVAWAKAGLVDQIVASCFWCSGYFATPLARWRALLGPETAARVPVYPGTDAGYGCMRGGPRAMPYEGYCGWADAQWANGAPGLYLFNLPYQGEALRARICGKGLAPDVVRKAARFYPATYDDVVPPGAPDHRQLPLALSAGGEIELAAGEPPRDGTVDVVLAARAPWGGATPDVTLNGVPSAAARALAPSALGTYRVRAADAAAGMRFTFPAAAMRRGRNVVGVRPVAGAATAWTWCQLEVPAPDALVLHVAPDGDDRADGRTPQRAFRTLARARDAVRAARRKGETARARVVCARGVYAVAETLAFGEEDVDTLYEGHGATLDARVAVTGWTARADGSLAAAAPGGGRVGQLWVNGRRAEVARWPMRQRDWRYGLRRLDLAHPKAVSQTVVTNAATGEVFAEQRLAGRAGDLDVLKGLPPGQLQEASLVVCHNWDVTRRIVRGFDAARGEILTTGRAFKPWNPWRTNSVYWIENVPGACTEPGTWYLDGPGGRIVYRPRPGECAQGLEARVPRAGLARLVAGRGPRGLVFRGFTFAGGDAGASARQKEPMQAGFDDEAAVVFDAARACAFEDCTFRHTGGYAVWFRDACQDCRIVRCHVYDCGSGGIRAGGTDRAKVSARLLVRNCLVEDCGHVNPCGVGLWIGEPRDSVFTHNHIRRILYSGVSMGWNWGYGGVGVRNDLSFNLIEDIGLGCLTDMAGIYTLGRQDGTRIHDNVIRRIDGCTFCRWALYLDQGSTGITAYNNLCYDAPDGGFVFHYGRDNVVSNNIFAAGLANHMVNVGRAEPFRMLEFTRNIVWWDMAEPYWDVREPCLAYRDYGFDRRPGTMLFTSNLWCCVNGEAKVRPAPGPKDRQPQPLAFADWSRGGDVKGDLLGDPLFADPAARDFRFTPGSRAVLARIGFVPFDFTRAGLERKGE